MPFLMPSLRSKIDDWLNEVRETTKHVVNAVEHRIKYGDPPILLLDQDLDVATDQGVEIKRRRIERRRRLLDLPYERYEPEAYRSRGRP